jgi:2-haloacid dehalogenase
VSERIRLTTFDCYGTLIDWEGGAAAFLYDLARRHEADPPPARELRSRWESLQFARLSGDWHPYRRVLADSLAELAGNYGWRWNKRDGEALARSMESWQPFPDTVPALRAAREAGIGLWIISNCDRAIIEHSLRHMDVDFDGVTVAEDCRAYKPSTAPFEHALRQIDLSPDEILHVAFGFKYDIAPAQQLGLRTAWVNRHREPPPGDARPDHEWSDLWPLADVA